MKLLKKNYYFVLEDFLPKIISGFTTPSFKSNSILDIKKIFPNKVGIANLKQIHSSKIHLVKKDGLYEGDGLFTSINDLVLIVKTADCLPIFLYSYKLDVIGLLHMGWRGALSGILNNIPYELFSFKVILGVGLRKCCYRVGREFLYFSSFAPFILRKKDFLYFNVVDFVRKTLLSKGLKEKNFFDLGICSFCSKELFFSYRRDKTNYRTISFITKN